MNASFIIASITNKTYLRYSTKGVDDDEEIAMAIKKVYLKLFGNFVKYNFL